MDIPTAPDSDPGESRRSGGGRPALVVLGSQDELGDLTSPLGSTTDPTVEFRIYDEETLDALQDHIYRGDVEVIVMRSVETLPCDHVSAELIVSGWRRHGIRVLLSENEPSGDGVVIKAALEEIASYGKIPWVP